jgi:hypothetical protein
MLYPIGGYVVKDSNPANPQTVKEVEDIKGGLKSIQDLYLKSGGKCEKSLRIATNLYNDAYVYLTVVTYDRPTSVDSFATEEDSKKWLFGETRVMELLLLTPNFKQLRKPSGAAKWSPEKVKTFEEAKSDVLKCWLSLRKRYQEKFENVDTGIELKALARKRFHENCYVKIE